MTLNIWAHRGASALAPENTIAAFRLAEELGARRIELDVDTLGDGTVVVIHDDTLDRTTTRTGPVYELTAADLPIDAGSWFSPEFAGEPLPTFAEVVTFLNGTGLRANIELKSPSGPDTAKRRKMIVDGVARLIPSLTTVPLVSSFDHRMLQDLREVNKDVPIAILIGVDAAARTAGMIAKMIGAKVIHPGDEFVTEKRVRRWKKNGYEVNVWTVNDAARARELESWGVDGIFTDDPRLLD